MADTLDIGRNLLGTFLSIKCLIVNHQISLQSFGKISNRSRAVCLNLILVFTRCNKRLMGVNGLDFITEGL